MKPTNKLRFVERKVPLHPFYKTVDHEGNLREEVQSCSILQQWWEEKQWAHEDYIVVGGEWRDIPIEEEGK